MHCGGHAGSILGDLSEYIWYCVGTMALAMISFERLSARRSGSKTSHHHWAQMSHGHWRVGRRKIKMQRKIFQR